MRVIATRSRLILLGDLTRPTPMIDRAREALRAGRGARTPAELLIAVTRLWTDRYLAEVLELDRTTAALEDSTFSGRGRADVDVLNLIAKLLLAELSAFMSGIIRSSRMSRGARASRDSSSERRPSPAVTGSYPASVSASARLSHRSTSSSTARSRGRAHDIPGSSTLNVAPRPGSLCTEIRP